MIPSPADLGFDVSKFPSWRKNQVQVIEDAIGCDKRFVGQMQRTGQGKTLAYMAQALLSKSRTMILTSTKGLQDQLLDDFGGMGLVSIKGKSNYHCELLPNHTCEDGTIGKCLYKGSTMCPWMEAKDTAMNSRLVTTNYSCWLATNRYGTGFGNFDMLIMDECHNAATHLEQAMRVTLTDQEIAQHLKWRWPDSREWDDMEAWKEWAHQGLVKADIHIQGLKEKLAATPHPSPSLIKDFRYYKNLGRKLADVATCNPEKWVSDELSNGHQFDPIDASEYAERILFRGIPRIILTSGTLKERTLGLLGIDPEEFEFFDYPAPINLSKSPLIYIPTAYLSRNSSEEDLDKVVARIDEIIEMRGDRRGIIHTSNFKMRDYIITNSKYSRFMLSNYTSNGDVTSHIIDRYKETKPPVVLVSPSVSTGYDFPFDFCRYQIIAKLPFPDLHSSKVEVERTKNDPKRGVYQMWQSLAQAFGRGDRAEEDWQECFVIDNMIEKMMMLYSSLAPWWLVGHYRKLNSVPLPPYVD